MIDAMSRRSISGWRAKIAVALWIAWLALVLAGWESQSVDAGPPVTSPDRSPIDMVDVADRLPGLWLREHDEDGVRTRRLLLLEHNGGFRERVKIFSTSGAVSHHEHAGTWLYDGTNLKRKYTLMNGRTPSRRNLPFATFELRFASRNEFVGIDHIHHNMVRYQRVPSETEL